MRLNSKSLMLLAAMVRSVSAATSTRGSLRRRLDMDMQQQLDLAALDLVASPEAALHSKFLSEAVYEKGGGKSSDTKKEAKASKGQKTPAPSPLFELPAGGSTNSPAPGSTNSQAPTKTPTLQQGSLPSARVPKDQKTKQPTVEKTKRPTVEKTKQPTVEKTKRPTIEKTKRPTVEKIKGGKSENTGKNSQSDESSKAPSPERTKGKTPSGGSNDKSDKGNNGGGKGKKGDSELTEDATENFAAEGKVAGGDSFLVDNPEIEERSLTVSAFQYTTTSTEKPGEEDYDELAIVTAEVVDDMYESFFDNLPDIDYGFMELHRYIAVTPRLVDFRMSSYFHRPSLIPSLAQVGDVASRGFGSGTEFYDLYLSRLQGMKSKVFSSTTSFRFINTRQGLKEAQEETGSGDRQDSWWGENIIKVVVPAAASFVAFFLCMFCVCHYRENRRPLTIEELTVLEAKAGDRRRGNASVSSNGTYASDYRTSVFSESTFGKEATLDSHLPMSEIRELSLDEELENVMSQLDEVALDSPEDAGVGVSWQSDELLVTCLAPPAEPREKESVGKQQQQLLPVVNDSSKKAEATSSKPETSSQTPRALPLPANDDAMKEKLVAIKPVATPQRQEQPEWMTRKLKAVAKPPSFLEVTTVVDAPSTPEGAPAAAKDAPITKKARAPIKVVATSELSAYKAPVSPEEETKPTWIARKLQPVGETPALTVLSKKVDAITSQPETTSNMTKDPPSFIVLAVKDKSVFQQSVASLDGGGKPAWMTRKLKSVANTPVVTADTTEFEVTTFQSETTPAENKELPAPIVITSDDSVVQLLVASSDEEQKPAEMTRKPKPVASQPVASPIEVQDLPISTGIVTEDENIAHQPKVSRVEERTLQWMIKKLRPVVKTPANVVTTKTDVNVFESDILSNQLQNALSTEASIDAPIDASIDASFDASTQASTDESATASTGESTNALTDIITKEVVEVTFEAPTHEELVVVSTPFVSLEEEREPGRMTKKAIFPVPQPKTMQPMSMKKSVEASLAEGQPVWMKVKSVAQVPELEAAQDSGAENTFEASLVEEERPGWLEKKPTIPVPELKAEANETVEASPAVPEWMQKFREMGL